jgi:ElaB/YqjD/DUF883 family membrane-anchored ribosome-binding protein
MSDLKTSQEKMSALGADVSSTVSQAVHKVRPAVADMAERVNDRFHDMAQHAKDAAISAEHQLEKEARHARKAAEQVIAHAPLQSVLIAAGTGAMVALAVSWMVQHRQH